MTNDLSDLIQFGYDKNTTFFVTVTAYLRGAYIASSGIMWQNAEGTSLRVTKVSL